jgi:putative chitinase
MIVSSSQILTVSAIALMCGVSATSRFSANAEAMIAALDVRAVGAGLNDPAVLAQYLAQVAHESGRFMWDEEVWGPTAAQARYDVRTDLGNSAARDGDGELFKGRTAMMVTGGDNYRRFRDWCRALFPSVPDFEVEPHRILEDPWEGLAPIWFWETNDLNRYARRGDIEMVTKTINGGLNGYADRLALYPRCALVLLGMEPNAVRAFQMRHGGLYVDGVPGPATRAAMHEALSKLPHWFPSETGVVVAGDDSAPAQTPMSAPEALVAIRGVLSRYDLSSTAKGA